MDDIHPWESPWSGEEPSCGSVVFLCRRHRSSLALSLRFCRVLELAGFSIGVVDRGIFSLPKLLARTVLIRAHLHHRFVFLILFFLSLFLAIDHLVLALSFWCCLDPLRPAFGARKQYTTFLFKIALASQPEVSSRCFQRGGGYYQGILLPSSRQFSRRIAPSAPLWSLLHPISSQLLDHNQLRRALHCSS